MKYLILTLAVLSITITSFGQNQDVQSQVIQTDTIGDKRVKTLLVPLVFFTPETNFAFGGGGQVFFKTKKSKQGEPSSNILASGIYTLNKQLMIEVTPQIYFGFANYYLDGKFRYKIFPNLFWGVGQNTPETNEEEYNQTEISFSVSFVKTLSKNVNFGFNYNFAEYEITETAEGGLMESGTIDGSRGASLRGLGLVLNIDSRDNKFSPLKGGFYQFTTNFTSRVLGSTHSFNVFSLDLRKYIRLGGNHILAVQLYSRFTFDDSPFQAKSWYGGGDGARGYFRGRYIDDHMYVAQLEYRLPIGKRFEMAAFALTGNVGNSETGTGIFNGHKPAFGLGPRFFIYKDKRTLLRLDIGVNNEGNSGIYFGVNEAF